MPKETQPEDELNPSLAKDLEEIVGTDYSKLEKQVLDEYNLAWQYMKPKYDEWAIRLKLYNNQKRDKEAIGDPLLFTIHQTVLASLYSDRLSVSFDAREEGDAEVAETLNKLAVFDYDEMQKEELDYDWDWDAAFFGRGLMMCMEFNRKMKCPSPEVIDVMTWLRDPRAISINGDSRKRGALRFGGREIRMTKNEMKKTGVYMDFDDLKAQATDGRSVVDANIQARAMAQGHTNLSLSNNTSGENGDFRLLEWFTIWKDKKILVTMADDKKKIVRYQELANQEDWPVVDRPLYPISHDWDGVSVCDLTEDKQRARSVLQNLGLAGVKLGLHPTYFYNSNLIKNRGNLEVDFNKHIPVDGPVGQGLIQPVERQQVKAEVGWIMDVLDTAAQKATATPDIQQGIQSDKRRTATELGIQTQKVDTRYSLSAKIWGWSEKRFWKIGWYDLYKRHFKDGIDEKVLRINGAMGPKWRSLVSKDIIATTDPDIKIESKVVSDAKKASELENYRLWIKDVIAVDPQNSNIRFGLRKMGELSGFDRETINQILPPNVDELNAEDENLKLNEGERVDVQVYDDDFIHMEVNNKAKDTPQKFAHIEAHKTAMMLKRANPAFDIAKNRPMNPEQAGQPMAPGMTQVVQPTGNPGIPNMM